MYEDLFSLRQGGDSLEDYYNHFKGIIDELNQYHPITNDIEVIKNLKNYMFVSFFQVLVLNSNHFENNY